MLRFFKNIKYSKKIIIKVFNELIFILTLYLIELFHKNQEKIFNLV